MLGKSRLHPLHQDPALPVSSISVRKRSACCQSVLSRADGRNPQGSHFLLENEVQSTSECFTKSCFSVKVKEKKKLGGGCVLSFCYFSEMVSCFTLNRHPLPHKKKGLQSLLYNTVEWFRKKPKRHENLWFPSEGKNFALYFLPLLQWRISGSLDLYPNGARVVFPTS